MLNTRYTCCDNKRRSAKLSPSATLIILFLMARNLRRWFIPTRPLRIDVIWQYLPHSNGRRFMMKSVRSVCAGRKQVLDDGNKVQFAGQHSCEWFIFDVLCFGVESLMHERWLTKGQGIVPCSRDAYAPLETIVTSTLRDSIWVSDRFDIHCSAWVRIQPSRCATFTSLTDCSSFSILLLLNDMHVVASPLRRCISPNMEKLFSFDSFNDNDIERVLCVYFGSERCDWIETQYFLHHISGFRSLDIAFLLLSLSWRE